MPDFNSAHTAADFEAAVPAALAAVQAVDLNTLAKLNTLIADATLIDTADSRLSNARTPTAHAASHATGGGDALTPAAIGAATAAQGNTADTAVQPARAINSGIGMEGGGDLSADRTLALTAAVLASLALADTATQPGDDADTLGSGVATDGQVLTADGAGNAAWEAVAVGGSAAGSDGEIQFALSGGFSADAGLAYNSTTKALTVGGATVTTDSPVLNLAQTWNAAGVTFTALKLNVTDTASAATSQLIDLQVGEASRFSVTKAGALTASGTITAGGQVVATSRISTAFDFYYSNASGRSHINALGISMAATVPLRWSAGSDPTLSHDLYLYRDAGGILAQRNGTNPQTFRLANTWTNASNLEHLSIGWAANVCTIATEALGTGTKRNLVLDGANRAAYSETPADIAAALVAHGIMVPA